MSRTGLLDQHDFKPVGRLESTVMDHTRIGILAWFGRWLPAIRPSGRLLCRIQRRFSLFVRQSGGRCLATASLLGMLTPTPIAAQEERPWKLILPEQRSIQLQTPPQIPVDVPMGGPPTTVTSPGERVEWLLSLDEAIHIAIQNSEAIRVAGGASVRVTGQTIYDVAIANTKIDAERAQFDPTLGIDNTFVRQDIPTAGLIVPNPRQRRISGFTRDGYNHATGIEKLNPLGGLTRFDIETNVQRTKPTIAQLNPLTTTRAGVSYVQPLLLGAGQDVTMAPIRIAQLETDRTFFQFKNSVQDMVHAVIQAYWRLAAARITVWATEKQVEQSRFASERAEARMRAGLADSAEVSQTRLAYYNFRSAQIVAKNAQLDTENLLRNLLFLPPESETEIIPSTALHTETMNFEWNELLAIVEECRPDLQELRTTVLADNQRIILAKSQALPQLNLVSAYGWTNTQGEQRNRNGVVSNFNASGSRYTDWTLGVNFDMPLGLREGRANVRGQELNYARDLANLRTRSHTAVHDVASAVRAVDRNYAEYQSYRMAREAAALNLEQQRIEYDNGRTIFLNLLLAISDWGTSVSQEIDALSRFNTELANLERQTGTILETHAIYFEQEKMRTTGPLGPHHPVDYPRDLRPTPNAPRYGAEPTPPEKKYFDEDSIPTTEPTLDPTETGKASVDPPTKSGWAASLTDTITGRRFRQKNSADRSRATSEEIP
ncbi:outer membrane channel protein [Planctopirus ephydatiae]|uniref:Outer membrane channel protein n=2 Tax=Planctopirus ephydatiae TaxID=2528019 RepID=A0A518GTF9_9PLAN|nr:outer membrane channel protein [Planctopirus ephydatiae]